MSISRFSVLINHDPPVTYAGYLTIIDRNSATGENVIAMDGNPTVLAMNNGITKGGTPKDVAINYGITTGGCPPLLAINELDGTTENG